MKTLIEQVRQIVLSHFEKYRWQVGISYDPENVVEDLMIECDGDGFTYFAYQQWEPLSPYIAVTKFKGFDWVTVATEYTFLECFCIRINGNEVTIDDTLKEPEKRFWVVELQAYLSFQIQEQEFREYEIKRERIAKLKRIEERWGES